jgi:outer membrane receptor for ferrienterochelin and colicins
MRRSTGAVGLALAIGLAPGSALADGDAELEGLLDQTVVTTASKSAENATNAPATSVTISAEQLWRFGIHSLDEAIDFLSLGVVTGNPLGDADVGARGVMMPGDRGAHFLLLVDGHAVNEPLYGMAHFGRGTGVPLEMVDRIEVILGPGSVLYGSNAMFGVINVFTKNAKHFSGLHVFADSEVGKSYRVGVGAGVPFEAFGSQGGMTLGFEYYRQRGPTLSFDRQGPSSYDRAVHTFTRYSRDRSIPANGIWGGDATDSYYADAPAAHGQITLGNFELNLHGSIYRRGFPYATTGLSAAAYFNDSDNYGVDRALWGDLKYRATLSRKVQLAVRLYADGRDEQRQYISTMYVPCADSTTGTLLCRTTATDGRYRWPGLSRWMGVDVQTNFDWLANETLVTTVGADARTIRVGSKFDTLDYYTGAAAAPSTRIIDAFDKTIGIYAQQTYRPAPAFGLNAGVRVDAGQEYSPVASPRASATVQTWRGGTVKAIFAQAFRAPTWEERASEDSLQLRPQDLKPERVTSGEISLEQRLGAHRVLFTGYRSRWTDLIENHALTQAEIVRFRAAGMLDAFASGVLQYRNLSQIDDWGFDAAAEGSIHSTQLRYGINFTGAVARARAQNGGDTQLVPVAPRYFGNARLAYDFLGPWPTLALATHWLARRPADRAISGQFTSTPFAPAQVELRATVSGPVPAVKGLSYRFSANYAFASRGPYVVGINQGEFPGETAYLVPVDQFRTTVGLQYDIDP